MKFLSLLLATTLASTVYAGTDLEGCISSKTHNQWNEASMIWYVPGTGEICDIPDCGGGRAPPKLDNPACPGQYTGTATYELSYLPGYGPGAAASTSTLAATASVLTTADAMTTTSSEVSVTGSLVITSAPSMTASATATMKTSIKAGNSSSVASTTSSSAGAAGTGNSAGMLELNVVGAVAAAALAVAAL